MRTPPTLVAALLLAALSLTACGNDSEDPSGSGSDATTVSITIKDGTVKPNGDRVEAEVGKPITLEIDADTAGELHVHSTPEQEISFDKGTSTKELTIDKPGIVDVEDHELEQVIVQLEVS
jgi:hypothetical protein